MLRLVTKLSKEVLEAYSRLPTDATVIQYPDGNAAFSVLLDKSFRNSGFDSARFPDLTSHKGVNLLLTPIWCLFLRRRGVQVINIHWITGPWQLPSVTSKARRAVLWIFFVVWVNILEKIGIRIVYTLHDHEPHSKVFNNDRKSVHFLIRKSHGVVFLNEGSKKVFSGLLKKQLSRVISEGTIKHPFSRSKDETRKLLKVPRGNKLLVLVGSLQEYKGVDLILSKLTSLPVDVSIRIAGTAPPEYQIVLKEMKEICDRRKLDIDIRFDFLSEEEFGEYLESADYFLYPCRLINNSGSLNAALSHGLPVIVPRISELSWVPENCKIYLDGETPETYDLQSAIDNLSAIHADRYSELSSNALDFSSDRSWLKVVESYIEFYEEIIGHPSQ
jgi:glycosyltransferase involved in cell wall biosynthesis